MSFKEKNKKTLLALLYERYDYINHILNGEFLKMYYDEWEIEEMRKELKRIDESIKFLKEE